MSRNTKISIAAVCGVIFGIVSIIVVLLAVKDESVLKKSVYSEMQVSNDAELENKLITLIDESIQHERDSVYKCVVRSDEWLSNFDIYYTGDSFYLFDKTSLVNSNLEDVLDRQGKYLVVDRDSVIVASEKVVANVIYESDEALYERIENCIIPSEVSKDSLLIEKMGDDYSFSSGATLQNFVLSKENSIIEFRKDLNYAILGSKELPEVPSVTTDKIVTIDKEGDVVDITSEEK